MNKDVQTKRHPLALRRGFEWTVQRGAGAIALGYRNVLWYRGGMEAWNHAGLQFVARRG